MQHTLEGNKLFPIVAWTLILSFSVFTYTLANDLKAHTGEIEYVKIHAQKAIIEDPNTFNYEASR